MGKSSATEREQLPKSQEKRKNPRYPFIKMITVMTIQRKQYIAESKNLSMGGIFLLNAKPLPSGTRGLLVFTIESRGAGKNVAFRFKVVRTQPQQDGSSGMGVEFVDMTDDNKRELAEIIGPL